MSFNDYMLTKLNQGHILNQVRYTLLFILLHFSTLIFSCHVVLKSTMEVEIEENCTFKPQIEKGCPFLSPRSIRKGIQRNSSKSKRSTPMVSNSSGLPSEEGIMVDELGGAVKVYHNILYCLAPIINLFFLDECQ